MIRTSSQTIIAVLTHRNDSACFYTYGESTQYFS